MIVTDVYFPEGHPLRALVYPGPRALDDPRLAALAENLDAASAAHAGDSFTVRAQGPSDEGDAFEEQLYRAQRAHTMAETILVFRRLATAPPDLDGLMPKAVAELLVHPALCAGGLLVICGGPGQGKTTTVAAAVAARLRAFGGVCVAAEDPPEIPLHGRHGAGLCLQMDVTPDRPLDRAIHVALRMFPVGVPTMIMVGEVRTRAAADEAVNAALNGTLVCMTLHASSQVEALHRLVGLIGGGEHALAALAASLKIILHQRLRNKVAHFRPFVIPEAGGESMRGNIRNGKFELLASDLQNQEKLLAQNKPIPA
jgi:twitching motility protein PilT